MHAQAPFFKEKSKKIKKIIIVMKKQMDAICEKTDKATKINFLSGMASKLGTILSEYCQAGFYSSLSLLVRTIRARPIPVKGVQVLEVL